MKRRTNKRFRASQKRDGATTVEFAMTIPILFLLLFAALEFTRAFMLIHSADNAAYEGARRGIIPGANVAVVEQSARTILDAMGARNVSVTVTPNTIDNNVDEVTVDISIPMNQNGFLAPVFFKNRQIRSTMTMRRERFDQTNVI